jgi:hypothetical protein
MDPGAGSGGSGAGPGDLTFAAAGALYRERLGTFRPAVAQAFVEVGLTLTNVGEPRPLPVTGASFLIGTADKLLYAGTFNEALANPCPNNVAVETGGVLSCNIAFQLPQSAKVTHVVYTDGMTRGATAQIAAVAPAQPACSSWQAPLPSPCAQCAFNQLGSRCVQADILVSNSCQSELGIACVSTDACPQIKGCTASAACAGALDGLQQCLYDVCFDSCPQVAF